MYMDSSQLDELADAYRVCVLRLYKKTRMQSDMLMHASNFLFWSGFSLIVASPLFFPQKMPWEGLLLICASIVVIHHAVKRIQSFHIPSPQELVEEARAFADALPDDCAWEERQACDALTEAIVSDDHVLIRKTLVDIESNEYMQSLREWGFVAFVKKAFA